MEALVKAIDGEIEGLRNRQTEIDKEIASLRQQKAEAGKEITRLGRAKKLLNGEAGSSSRSGAKKAGPAAVKKVSDALAEKGKATQADLTRDLGLNSGQVSAALASLKENGVVRETGVRIGRTREFEYVG